MAPKDSAQGEALFVTIKQPLILSQPNVDGWMKCLLKYTQFSLKYIEVPKMLAEQCGKLIRDARVRKGLKQEDLANKAQVSRAVLSRLEQGRPKPVQSDTLDRLLAALEISPEIARSSGEVARKLARLEQELSRRERRERHLRLAISLSQDESTAAAKIAKARQRVALWRSNRSCSQFYIDRWAQLLALPPRKMAKEMSSLGEWEDALFQNSPWSWAWT